MMSMEARKLRPLGKRALLDRDNPKANMGGIIVPERYRKYGWTARVVRLGEEFDGPVREGDKVFYRRGKTVLPFNDRKYAVTSGDCLMAIIKPDAEKDYEIIVPLGDMVLVEPDELQSKTAKQIALPEKTTQGIVTSGTILRVGEKCKDVAPGDKVGWDGKAFSCACVENDCEIVLLFESDILYKAG